VTVNELQCRARSITCAQKDFIHGMAKKNFFIFNTQKNTILTHFVILKFRNWDAANYWRKGRDLGIRD